MFRGDQWSPIQLFLVCKGSGDPRCTPSETLSPLVLEGAVVSEGQFTASGGFGVVSGPRSSWFFALRTQCLAPSFQRGCRFGKSRLCIAYAMLGPRFRRGLSFRKCSCKHRQNVCVRELVLVLVLSCELCCSRPWGLLPGRKPSLASPLPSSAQIPPQPSSHRAFTCTTRPS